MVGERCEAGQMLADRDVGAEQAAMHRACASARAVDVKRQSTRFAASASDPLRTLASGLGWFGEKRERRR